MASEDARIVSKLAAAICAEIPLEFRTVFFAVLHSVFMVFPMFPASPSFPLFSSISNIPSISSVCTSAFATIISQGACRSPRRSGGARGVE